MKFEVTLADGRTGSVPADRYTQEPDGFVTFWRGSKQVHRIDRAQISKLLLNAGKRLFMLGTGVLIPLGALTGVIGLVIGLVWGLWPALWLGALSLAVGIALPITWGAFMHARTDRATQVGMAAYFATHPTAQPGSPESLAQLAQVINEATGITVARLDEP